MDHTVGKFGVNSSFFFFDISLLFFLSIYLVFTGFFLYFEKLLRKKKTQYVESNKPHNSEQNGFITGRSCFSQLADCYYSILEAVEKEKNVVLSYLHRLHKGF